MRTATAIVVSVVIVLSGAPALAQLSGQPPQTAAATPKPGQAKQDPAKAGQKPPAKPASKTTPSVPDILQPPPAPVGYTIGPDDVLLIQFWRDTDMTREVTVRPDGKISLPLLNDVVASGLTPDELRDRVTEAAKKYVEDPNVTIIVRQINSRKVFVTGSVARPGPYPMADTMTVLQAIAIAGGLTEYANTKNISVVRTEAGRSYRFKFNYKEVMDGKNLKQNIPLKPGDTVIVP